jgi:serine/threonine protein kinase
MQVVKHKSLSSSALYQLECPLHLKTKSQFMIVHVVHYPTTALCTTVLQLHKIEFMHSKGVINQEMKPQNTLMKRGGKAIVVHVVDFGLGRISQLDQEPSCAEWKN